MTKPTLPLGEHASNGGQRSSLRVKEFKLPTLDMLRRKEEKQPILLPKPLRKISQTMSSEGMRREAGFPTCIAISERFIAVGTAHGLILLFDHRQDLKRIMGTSIDFEYGPVTAVDISETAESVWLACGHERGHVVIWDALSGRSVKTLDDIHASAIVSLRFINDKGRLISIDLAGQVFQLTLTKSFWSGWVVDVVMILNGKSGQILALSPLIPCLTMDHPIESSGLVAMCLAHLTMIVRLYPNVEILYKLPRPKETSGFESPVLPYLAWRQMAARKDASGRVRVYDPMLAVSWGPSIQLLQISFEPQRSVIQFVPRGSHRSDANISGMDWLGQRVIVFLNVKDQLRVFDPFTVEEIETMDVKALGLVYHSRFTKADSFHHSFRSHKERVYLLGMEKIHSAHILTWEERLALLVDKNKWLDALSLALDLYEGHAKAVVGLPADLTARKEIMSDKIIEILISYVHITTTSEEAREADDLWVEVCAVCLEYLLYIDRTEVLFRDIYSMFVLGDKQELFLQLLEPCILSDRLKFVGPEVMQAFVEYNAKRGKLAMVERCILHLDIASMDFHQVVTVCREHELWEGLIYVYNKGLGDYLTPLDFMMQSLQALIATPPVADEASTREWSTRLCGLADKTLAYISFCLSASNTDEAKETIPARLVANVKAQIYNYLFIPALPNETREYPRLCWLAQVDMAKFLGVMGIALEDPDRATTSPLNHQTMFHILQDLILARPAGSTQADQFSAVDVNLFLNFTGKYVAKRAINVSEEMLKRVLTHLTRGGAREDGPEREQLMLNLVLAHPSLLDQSLLIQLENATPYPFYAVSEVWYRKANDYKNILKCYLNHPVRKQLVFGTIQDLLKETMGNEKARETLTRETLGVVRELIGIDPKETAALIQSFVAPGDDEQITRIHQQVTRLLKPYPRLLYQYLHTLLGPRKQTRGESAEEQLRRAGQAARRELQEQYLRLMCEYEKGLVLGYLEWLDTSGEIMPPIDFCLRVTREFGLADAQAYLLERMGDLVSALEILLKDLDVAIQQMIKFHQSAPPVAPTVPPISALSPRRAFPETAEEKAVVEGLDAGIALCQRNSQRLDESENEVLWFKLLDAVVIPLRRLKSQRNRMKVTKPNFNAAAGGPGQKMDALKRSKQGLEEAMRVILSNMMGHVQLRAILDKIVQEHGADEFGDFRWILSAMTDQYSYEISTMRTVLHLVQGDTNRSVQQLYKAQRRGVSSAGSTCSQCRRPFLDSSALTAQPAGTEAGEAEGQAEVVMPAGVALFPCTHAFHAPCLGRARACPLCSKQKRPKSSASTDDLPRTDAAARPPQTIQDSIQDMIAGTKGALVQGSAANVNGYTMQDYLARLDKYKPHEYSRLQMLYKLAGKGQQAGGRARAEAGGSPLRPQSLPAHADRKGWRGATHLTAEDIEREGFRLSRPHN